MADYEFRGSIDSGGNLSGTFRRLDEGDTGPLAYVNIAVIYILSLIGGIIMITINE